MLKSVPGSVLSSQDKDSGTEIDNIYPGRTRPSLLTNWQRMLVFDYNRL